MKQTANKNFFFDSAGMMSLVDKVFIRICGGVRRPRPTKNHDFNRLSIAGRGRRTPPPDLIQNNVKQIPCWNNNIGNQKNQNGVALILVMWTLLALSIIAVQLCQSAKIDIKSLSAEKGEIDAGALALSALNDARGIIPAMKLESVSGGQTVKTSSGETIGSYTFTVIDESGRMDLGAATEKEIATLLRLLGAGGADALGAKIARRRDSFPGGSMLGSFELLSVDGVGEVFFTGEDADGDLALDPNENDGAKSFPPDNSDGEMTFGLSRYVRAGCPGKMKLSLATREALLAATGLSPEEAAKIGGKQADPAALSGEKLELFKEKTTDRSSCFRVIAKGIALSDGYYLKDIDVYIYVDSKGRQHILSWRES